MNQTESGRKAEGSGVGILSDARPATSARSAASAMAVPGSGCTPISRRPTLGV
jgi:hypothetical protein